MFILCHAAKNEPRKRAKGCRLWKPPSPPFWRRTAERQSFASLLHLRGIYPTPQMGSHGKNFCFFVLLELSSITGREAKTNVLCESEVRATPVFASFFNLQTQKLKMLTFAPQLGKIYFCRGALRESKGHYALWRVFSSFLSRDKKDNPYHRRALCGGKQEEKSLKIQLN